MKAMIIALCLIFASALSTVTILATCGTSFSPATPQTSNQELWGTGCNGSFGKAHHWDITWNGHEVSDKRVSDFGECIDNHACYPGFDTPVWRDSNKNEWNEVTHKPIYSIPAGQCESTNPETFDHPEVWYCHASEAEDADTCQANGWYWNFSSSTCSDELA